MSAKNQMMIKKKITLAAFVFFAILSCNKDKKNDPAPEPAPYVNPYPRPWNTQFISAENIIGGECGNPKYSGYKLFYKDTLLQSVCGTGITKRTIGGSLRVNDSIMHFFMSGD